MTLDEGRAALERGRPVVLVTPPAPEQAAAVWELAPGLSSGAGTPLLIACGDAAGAAAWAALAPAGRRAHAVTGLARATRVLKEHPPDVLLGAFLERHARRAEVIGTLPLAPAGPARYAVVPPSRRPAALRDALELLDPKRPHVWRGEPVDPSTHADAVFCLQLPTREQLAALAALAPVVVFVTGSQLPYLAAIAAPLTPIRLTAAVERAQDRAHALRTRIVAQLEARQHDAELTLLDPLFERYDPAEVAAATLALLGDEGRGKGEGASPLPAPAAGWVKVFVNVGKKDRASAKDLVGALIREVGLAKTELGRIDVRETFSVVDVAAAVADRVVKELTGVTIRGRRAMARLDRYS